MGLKAARQRIDGEYNEKVDDSGHDQKADDCNQKSSYLEKPIIVNGNCPISERLIARNRYKGRNNARNESSDNGSKSSADHYADGQVNHVATQDESAEAAQGFPGSTPYLLKSLCCHEYVSSIK